MNNKKTSRGLNLTLWIVQSLLAAMFLMAGINKIFQPMAELAKMLPWVTEMPSGLVRFIGFSELLGGLGMVLPSLLRIRPVLTPISGIGLAMVMLFAAIFHLSRGEASVIGMNAVLMALALLVAWGRFKKAPIHAK